MIKELGPGLRLTLALTILTGLLYPAVMTGLSELIFPRQANGSLVTVNGKIVGSSLIGQSVHEAGILSSAAFGGRQRLRRDRQQWHEPGPHERQAPPWNDQNG